MQNNKEMVEYFLDKNEGSIACIKDYQRDAEGIEVFRLCNPSEEILKLYFEKEIYDPETLLKVAREYRNGNLLKTLAKMQKLTVDDIIDRILKD